LTTSLFFAKLEVIQERIDPLMISITTNVALSTEIIAAFKDSLSCVAPARKILEFNCVSDGTT